MKKIAALTVSTLAAAALAGAVAAPAMAAHEAPTAGPANGVMTEVTNTTDQTIWVSTYGYYWNPKTPGDYKEYQLTKFAPVAPGAKFEAAKGSDNIYAPDMRVVVTYSDNDHEDFSMKNNPSGYSNDINFDTGDQHGGSYSNEYEMSNGQKIDVNVAKHSFNVAKSNISATDTDVYTLNVNR